MNKATSVQHLMQAVSGQLLYAGYQYDDGLALDLYGSVDDGEHGVESVAVAGTNVEIGQLFSARKLELFGLWLDVNKNPAAAQVAARYRYALAALPD